MKDPLCAQICEPGPYSSDVPHSGTLLYFDAHIVTESYGTLNVLAECLSEPGKEEKGGGWDLWVQQQSGLVNPC
ncbi:FH2 domain-containing protein 1-like protein [Lates japonicus]|uniref:FH2 domain-containing protein 1-like protein n=1 Tax=Lates japonicus TaxID=270547 RepID=A0AAD3RKS6_LATJO|nr:FH2 domain-containing protein 1-like protein [Lates japonicus]